MDNIIAHQKNDNGKDTHSEDSAKNNETLPIESSRTKNYRNLSQINRSKLIQITIT